MAGENGRELSKLISRSEAFYQIFFKAFGSPDAETSAYNAINSIPKGNDSILDVVFYVICFIVICS